MNALLSPLLETNRRINHQLVPKGSALNKFSTEEVQKIEDWVNNYPREIFGYATSQEMFNNQLQAV